MPSPFGWLNRWQTMATAMPMKMEMAMALAMGTQA